VYELSTGFNIPVAIGIAGQGVIEVDQQSFSYFDEDLADVTKIDTTVVPLPASALLLLTGFSCFGWLKRRTLVPEIRRKLAGLMSNQAAPA